MRPVSCARFWGGANEAGRRRRNLGARRWSPTGKRGVRPHIRIAAFGRRWTQRWEGSLPVRHSLLLVCSFCCTVGDVGSSRSIVPEAQRVCRSSNQNTSVSLARLCGARGSDFASSPAESYPSPRLRRTGSAPSRSGPSHPLLAPYVDAHAWQARGAGPGAGRDRCLSDIAFSWSALSAVPSATSDPRDPSFPKPSAFVDQVIRIRL